MSPSKVKAIVDTWTINTEKTFYYYEHLLEEEILTVVRLKTDLFEVDVKKSSVNAGPWNEDQMTKLLSRDGLVPKLFNNTWRYWDRADGCECGAWRTRNPECHSYWCPKYRG